VHDHSLRVLARVKLFTVTQSEFLDEFKSVLMKRKRRLAVASIKRSPKIFSAEGHLQRDMQFISLIVTEERQRKYSGSNQSFERRAFPLESRLLSYSDNMEDHLLRTCTKSDPVNLWGSLELLFPAVVAQGESAP
jgi:hypothetical protein